MSQQRPANTFRNQPTNPPASVNNPRPTGTNAPKTPPTNRPRTVPTNKSAGVLARFGQAIRWKKVRSFVRERPLLERVYWWVVKAVLGIFLFSLGWVIVLKWVPVWVTPLVVSRKIDAMRAGEESRVYKHWRSYDDMSKEAALAVVSSEDQAFPTHWGFDFDEIQDAIKENQTRKRPRGASTISQQVAKNVFLWNGRSYIRKGLEIYFTVLIELIWGKKRILEVYLNVAETGPMTFGVDAASQRYYGHAATSLSRDEAARIAAVLPNPRQFSIKSPSNYIQRRTRQIARQMRYLGGQKYIRSL
jgi:monofunctional glycosyltransferase